MTIEEEALKLTQQGHAYRCRGDWQHAVECYKRALDLSPLPEAQGALEQAEEILSTWHRSMYDV